MASDRIREIMSGESDYWRDRQWRFWLGCASKVYGTAVAVRNAGYDRGWGVSHLDVGVVSVGNITAGGTGKTPMVVLLARLAREMGHRPAILSRGYRGEAGWNDENRLLKDLLGDVPVVVNSDRVAGGHYAVQEYQADLLILDDGFQHRRLGRDLDIVLIDATCPFGYGHVLPRGLLRESLVGLRRADLVVITRSDLVRQETLEGLRIALRQSMRPEAALAEAVHKPLRLMGINNNMVLEGLVGKYVYAFCTIGNARAFSGQLEELGAKVKLYSLPDHADYTSEQVMRIREEARQFGADLAVTTEKDWMKLREIEAAREWGELYRLRIKLEMTKGYDILTEKMRVL